MYTDPHAHTPPGPHTGRTEAGQTDNTGRTARSRVNDYAISIGYPVAVKHDSYDEVPRPGNAVELFRSGREGGWEKERILIKERKKERKVERKRRMKKIRKE